LYDIAMRTIVDIPEHDSPDGRDAAFGLWKDRHQDGLAYQEALRDEWNAPTVHEPPGTRLKPLSGQPRWRNPVCW